MSQPIVVSIHALVKRATYVDRDDPRVVLFQSTPS